MKRVVAILLTMTSVALGQLDNQLLREKVDASIERGLEYLMTGQREDGSFPEKFGTTVAIPSLVGMAFLSKGYVPGEGRYGLTITRCINYVLKNADGDGYFGNAGRDTGGGDSCGMYAHSIATLFLSEVSGMVDAKIQKRIDMVLPAATRILLRAQSVKKKDDRDIGGWRYRPNSNDSDLSCSGWCLMALRSAKLNGAQVPARAIAAAVSFVQRHSNPEEGGFYYKDSPKEFMITLTGAGILCLELCGKHNDPASLRAARYLAKNYRNLGRTWGHVFYGVYYTSQGLFQMGGEAWKNYAEWMYETWIPKQLSDGSWNHGEGDSSYYQTAMIILAFTVPYRQLPIYQRDETVDE